MHSGIALTANLGHPNPGKSHVFTFAPQCRCQGSPGGRWAPADPESVLHSSSPSRTQTDRSDRHTSPIRLTAAGLTSHRTQLIMRVCRKWCDSYRHRQHHAFFGLKRTEESQKIFSFQSVPVHVTNRQPSGGLNTGHNNDTSVPFSLLTSCLLACLLITYWLRISTYSAWPYSTSTVLPKLDNYRTNY